MARVKRKTRRRKLDIGRQKVEIRNWKIGERARSRPGRDKLYRARTHRGEQPRMAVPQRQRRLVLCSEQGKAASSRRTPHGSGPTRREKHRSEDRALQETEEGRKSR